MLHIESEATNQLFLDIIIIEGQYLISERYGMKERDSAKSRDEGMKIRRTDYQAEKRESVYETHGGGVKCLDHSSAAGSTGREHALEGCHVS